MDLAAGTVVGGRYEVDQLLGRGGMATVYRVWHLGLGTCHALKVLQTASEGSRERLLREGRLQGQLRHPNVVGVTDHVEVNGSPGLVLEMVEGPPLSALLGGDLLTLDQVDLIGSGVLAGVAAAHRHHLVHRDLKPANVLVSIREGRPLPKVSDFGLALALDDEDPRRTRTGAHLGTPQYMSPEQVRDAKNVDERSDVWSLGVLLYELATGVLPFRSADRLELFQAIAAGTFVPVAEVRPELPERMREAIGRALVVDREARPADAVALLAIWAASSAELPIDPLVARVRSLAPASSSRSGTPTPVAPVLTWTPETRAADPPATSSGDALPASSPSSSEARPPAPPSAVAAVAPASTAAPAWVPLLVAGSLGGVVLLALVAVAAVVWIAGRSEVPPVVAPVIAPPPPVAQPDHPDADDPPRALPTKARERLLEGHFTDAAHQAGFLLAMPGTEAEVLSAVSRRVVGDGYGPLEELERSLRQDDGGRVQTLLEMQTDPIRGAAWLRDHPDDLEVRVWWVLHACPGVTSFVPESSPATCAAAAEQVEALRRLAPGRAVAAWAATVVARETGRLDEAELALAELEGAAADGPLVRVEEAKLLLARGRFEDAAAIVEPLLEDRATPVGAFVVRGLVDRELGREGHRVKVDGLVAGQLWERQIVYARAIADWERAHGRGAEAVDRLRTARHALDPYNDALVRMFDLELCLDLMELGAELHDPGLMEEAAVGLAAVVSADLAPWAKQVAERARLLGDGIRLVGRRRPADAQRVLASLRVAGATDAEVIRLTRLLSGTSP